VSSDRRLAPVRRFDNIRTMMISTLNIASIFFLLSR